MTLRVVELFAGIGAQAQALKNLGIEFESTVCEIDRHAYASYCAIHGDTPNLGDITKVEHLPECDLLTYSFPCQDLSIAGCQRGMKQSSGTRSSLLWEVGRLLSDAKEREREPEVLLMENVDAILNKKNIDEFKRWIRFLTDLGYTSEHAVLNAKDFGVPQNRKRCFMVSALGGRRFVFPEGFPLETRLRDFLEDDVDESFYLSDDKVAKYKAHDERQRVNGTGFGWRPSEPGGVSPAVLTSPAKSSTNTIILSREMMDTDVIQAKRVYDTRGISPSITAGCGTGSIAKIEVVGNLNIKGRHEQINRVYGPDGLAPTLPTGGGGGVMPKIEVVGTLGGYEKEDRVHNPNGLSPTLNLCRPDHSPKIEAQDSIRYPCATAKGYMEAREGDGLVMNRVLTARGTVQEATAPTLTTGNGCGTGTVDKGLRIRYLTPRECWRLMGFPDSAYEAARDVPTSKTQLYKQAGNSIAVPCLEAIFWGIYIDRTWHCRPSLEVWM